MPLFDPSAEIPGYAEAAAKQDFVRDVAFLGVPKLLGGLEVAPLTFRHLLWLQLIELVPETLPLAVAGFFKTIAPLAKPSYMLTRFDEDLKKDLKKYMRDVGRLPVPAALAAIREHVTDTFMDAPGGKDGAKGESYYSVGAALTHRLAKNYPVLNANPGQFPGALDVPIKAGFQLLKLIARDDAAAAGRTVPQFNGLTSSLKSRWLETQNQPSTLN